jgi:hypoxanthine-guanine phosphoribosyltransferase
MTSIARGNSGAITLSFTAISRRILTILMLRHFTGGRIVNDQYIADYSDNFKGKSILLIDENILSGRAMATLAEKCIELTKNDVEIYYFTSLVSKKLLKSDKENA